jgi:hypothetical protein
MTFRAVQGNLVQLIQGYFSAATFTMLVHGSTNLAERGIDTPSHVGFYSISVAQEFVDNQFWHDQANPTLVAQHAKCGDQLLAVWLFCQVKPNAGVYEKTNVRTTA